MFDRPSWIVRLVATCVSVGWLPAISQAQDDPAAPTQGAPTTDPGSSAPGSGPEALPGPPPIPDVPLGPALPTTPVRRGVLGVNATLVDASVLPRDKQGIWVLDFAFKPVRLQTVEIPGKGRRIVHYLYYQLVNNTDEPRMFVPQFTLVTDTGKTYQDSVIPQAVKVVENREDPTKPLLGAVDIVGMVPPNGKKEGIDDAVYGVAVWEGVDPAADQFSIYIRGLSDGYQLVTPPGSAEPQTHYKTLRLDFNRLGDEFNINEQEIRLAEPPYEWIYW